MEIVLELARHNPAHAVLVAFTGVMLLVAIAMAVAASLLRRSNNRKARRWAQLEADWRLALDDIAAGRLSEAELHATIRGRARLVFVDFLYKTQVREGRRARRALHAALAQPYLGDLEQRFATGDVWQRSRAVRTLAELYGALGASTIQAALDDPAPLVATTSARAYARLQLGEITPLLDRLDRYVAWDRRLLRLTLASFGARAAPALLARYAEAGAPVHARVACADALIDVVAPGANEVVASVLESEQDRELVVASLRLVQAPTGAALLARIRELCGSADAVVRAQAVGSLVRCVPDADELPEVQRAREDESPWVVLNALRQRPGWAARWEVRRAVAAGGER